MHGKMEFLSTWACLTGVCTCIVRCYFIVFQGNGKENLSTIIVWVNDKMQCDVISIWIRIRVDDSRQSFYDGDGIRTVDHRRLKGRLNTNRMERRRSISSSKTHRICKGYSTLHYKQEGEGVRYAICVCMRAIWDAQERSTWGIKRRQLAVSAHLSLSIPSNLTIRKQARSAMQMPSSFEKRKEKKTPSWMLSPKMDGYSNNNKKRIYHLNYYSFHTNEISVLSCSLSQHLSLIQHLCDLAQIADHC